MAERDEIKAAFLAGAGWQLAERHFLAADSSMRSYERLRLRDKTAVLMDAPPEKDSETGQFVQIAHYLSHCGISAPRILAEDVPEGFLLLEDLGDDLFAQCISNDLYPEPLLYAAATDVLVHLQSQPPPTGLSNLSAAQWADAAAYALDWYRFAITGDRLGTDQFKAILTDHLQRFADGPRVMVLRDYHAENLLWLPDRIGIGKVGVLDFQLAQMGQPGYDLVSLLQDARRDVAPEVETAMIRRFVTVKGCDESTYRLGYATLGAQRALRIIGIFARLCLAVGKPGYVAKIPRVWAQLQRNLQAPQLKSLADICSDLLPVPTAENLSVIESKCNLYR